MKRLFLFELAFYWILHVVGPLFYYHIRGEYVYIYQQYCPPEYMNKAAVIISIPIIITFILVAFVLPFGQGMIQATLNRRIDVYFYFGCLFMIMQQMHIGQYTNSAVIHGTIWAYASMFFDLGALLLAIYVTANEKVNLVLMGGLYLAVTLIASSRQGALILVIALLAMLITTQKYMRQRKVIFVIILCICLASPFGYMYATTRRGGPVGEGIELLDQIVGRCSNLELLGDALYQQEEDIWNAEVFERKYSVSNQLKICINSLMIGDVFEADVYPNQYYRTVFQKVPEQQAKETYTSINLTLPGYLNLKYPLFFAIFITVCILTAIYTLACLARWPRYVSVILLINVTNSFLDYFDWVMIVNDLLRLTLTLGAFYLVEKIVKDYVPPIKKRLHFRIKW